MQIRKPDIMYITNILHHYHWDKSDHHGPLRGYFCPKLSLLKEIENYKYLGG